VAFYSDLNYIKPSVGASVEDVDSVFQAIFTLLGTKRGERLFRPTYGASLQNYLFEPCDEFTAKSILFEIQTTLKEEPRIKFNVSKSSVIPVPEQQLFLITIVFTVLGFNNLEKSLNLTLKQKNRNV
jgi:phage baseplate assembly protein W